MKTTKQTAKYVEWFSAEEMHQNTLDWLSELEFAQDEHLFLEDLIKLYTLPLIDSKMFSESKEIVDAVNRSEKRNNRLIETIKIHRNKLQIMIDGINQLKEEESYKKEHQNLIVLVKEFLKDYRSLKTQLFEIIQDIIKKERQKRLLDKR